MSETREGPSQHIRTYVGEDKVTVICGQCTVMVTLFIIIVRFIFKF